MVNKIRPANKSKKSDPVEDEDKVSNQEFRRNFYLYHHYEFSEQLQLYHELNYNRKRNLFIIGAKTDDLILFINEEAIPDNFIKSDNSITM